MEETAIPFLKHTNLSALIEENARQFPDQTAVIYRDQRLSYTALIKLSNQFTNYLLASGIKKGDIIGFAVECSIEMLVCMLGLLKAGAVYVPIDPKYPKERIEYMLSDANAKLLLVAHNSKGKFNSNATEVIIENIWADLNDYPSATPKVTFDSSGLAYILYTSGSTGKPKGVKITHANLINLLTSIKEKPGITPADRLLAITTISFDIAGLELFLPLITGAELLIADLETARDGRLLLDMMEKQHITIMQATPATWRMMVDAGWHKTYPVKIFCGGEPLPRDLADQLIDRSRELWNMYGPTETTIYSIIKQVHKEEIITIGTPISHTQIYLYNEQMELVQDGETGEIFIGGAGVAAGYLNQPELTAERFVNDPFSAIAGARLYKTGDLGRRLGNGDIEYLGRIDQQVKIRGHRIELGEIENLLAQHPNVKQAVLVAREDNPGDKRLVAYLLLKSTPEVPVNKNVLTIPRSVTDSFKEHLKLNLPQYMIPNEYIVLQSFPLTPNYKIDKNKLPAPQPKTGPLTISHLPKNENEHIITNIWSKVLAIKSVSTQDDFFDMGGNSLSAVKMMAQIEQQTGKHLPLAVLFENPTIEKLAKKMSSTEEEKWIALVPIKTSGTKPPLYLVHGGGLNIILFKSISNYLDPEQPLYGLQAIGLNKPVQLLDSIEEIASVYNAEIIASNPQGPYCLAGYSLGGLLAWEMAKQLIAAGREVKFVGILDTYAGNGDPDDQPLKKILLKLQRQFNKIPFILSSFIRYPKEAAVYQLMMLKHKLFGNNAEKDLPDAEFFTPYETEIYRSYRRAQSNYKLIPAAIEINLFKVKKRLYFLSDMEQLGWGKIATKGVKVNVIPGDHKTFLYPPNDKEFASVLQKELDKI